jgi:hypothetical protein
MPRFVLCPCIARLSAWFGTLTFACSFWLLPGCARPDNDPLSVLRAAIEAHGGEERLAHTWTGTLLAKGTLAFPPEVEASFSWEESFDLPRRYRRCITGRWNGQDFRLEYAITDGSGWIRKNGREPVDYDGEPLPLYRSPPLALLPSLLDDGVDLAHGGKDRVEGREAVGVRASGEVIGGDAELFFDRRSKLLVKSKRRIQHPLLRREVAIDVILGDYREVSGVQYPHRITAVMTGETVADIKIARVQFVEALDDGLFEKP